MSAAPSPAFVCVGGVFIDDIVYPDGRTRMGVLGGGGTHTAAGMRVWGERPGFVAAVGRDLEADIDARLAHELDTRGVVRLDLPQVRAWQLFEWDGHRTEIMRVQEAEPFFARPAPEEGAAAYPDARTLAVLRDARQFLAWRARFPDALVLWEPEQAYMVAEHRDEFAAALPHADIVSPNLEEARGLYGIAEPAALVRRMLADGAGVVALRMGEHGALVGARGDARLARVPPVPVPELVDQTGAGNSFCGGFLVGWRRTSDARAAGCSGAVSASFTLEVVGVPEWDSAREPERDARYASVLKQSELV